MARLPGDEDTWLGWGHTVTNEGPFAENTELCAMMLLTPWLFFPGTEEALCPLPGGKSVRFYQMIPIYQEELDLKLRDGAQALLKQMERQRVLDRAAILDPNRPNACQKTSPKKQFTIPGEAIQPILLGWEGPDGCIATDRIVVDGCKVGYMYREEPDPGRPDSGWRFTAGDESDEYLDAPEHSGIYTLNTLCNRCV